MSQPLDMELLRQWEGRREEAFDAVVPVPALALQATLEAPQGLTGQRGEALPPLWHWLYFLPLAARGELGEDGHPRRGGFLPPVPLSHRMWAGGRLVFGEPLRIGDSMRRVSTIAKVEQKEGRSGPLVFVTVRHDIEVDGEPRLQEEHDIVYRGESRPAGEAPPPARAEAGSWQRRVDPDDVLLFRYSALTFNGHRIHYDRRFATDNEGYPGLVVHGPLIATLLVDLLCRQLPGIRLTAFSYRARHPIFDTAPFLLHGKPATEGGTVRLWAADDSGQLAMEAVAELQGLG